MNRIYSVLMLSALPFLSQAQDIADNSFSAGGRAAWTKEEDMVNGSINKTTLGKMKGVTAALVGVLEGTVFAGADAAAWHGDYSSAKNSAGPLLQYGVECHWADAHAALSITANDVQALMGHLAIGGQDYLTMDISSSTRNNGQYFSYTDADGNTVKRWLITTAGRMPYVAVTRKEYLAAAKMELAAIRENIIAGVKAKVDVRPAAVQEAEKKAAIDQLNQLYAGAALEYRVRQFEQKYMSDEDYLKASILKETAGVDETIQVMNDLLAHMSAAQLGMPAIVSVPAIDFNGFEDGHTDKMLVKMDPTYINGALSGDKPQVFLVEWKYDAGNAGAVGMDKTFTGAFDAEVLRGMLGK